MEEKTKSSASKRLEKKKEKELQQKNNLELFEQMYEICSKWEDVEIGTTTKYIKLMIKRGKMFAEATLTGKCLKVTILDVIEDLGNEWISIEEGLTVRKVPENFGWVLNTEFKIVNKEQLKAFIKYLGMSYQIRLEEKNNRELKEKRLQELNRNKILEPIIFDNGRKSLGQLKMEMMKAKKNYKNGKISKSETVNLIMPYIERQYELSIKRYNEFKEICKAEELTINIERPSKLKVRDILK